MIKKIIIYISSGNYVGALVMIAALMFVLFCTMPVHEYAHAWMAVKLGDDTPRLSNRLTLNPLAHISPIGALMIVIVGVGYANPVPVNIHNLKHPKRDFALVALAGPVSNLIMAFIFSFLLNLSMQLNVLGILPNVVSDVIYSFFYFATTINISLAVFNLVPIPPLDGSRILNIILPDKYYYRIMQYERYILYGILALLFFGVLDKPIDFLSGLVFKALYWLTSMPFKLIFG